VHRLKPGDYAAVGLIGSALAIDVVLLRNNCEAISSCVRRSRTAKVITALLAAHLLASWRHDPLTALADRITRSSPSLAPKR
jgi:hypothetical protein